MKNSYFLSQPHQPFFALSFINAILSIFLLALYSKGILVGKLQVTIFHIYSIIYMVFTPGFWDFLFHPTFPKIFNQTRKPGLGRKGSVLFSTNFPLPNFGFLPGSPFLSYKFGEGFQINSSKGFLG